MARIRTIKPEFWKNEALSSQPESTHLLAAALLNYADDEGYFNANPALIKAECSPLREPAVGIVESLNRLAAIGYLKTGKAPDGRQYGAIINFAKHQKVSHPSPSKLKDLGIAWNFESHSGGFPSDSALNREQGKEQGKESFVAPSATTNCDDEQRHDYPDEFEAFWLAYPSRNGRKRGKRKTLGIWRQAIGKGQRQALIEAATHYAGSREAQEGFARDPERFLKADWWRDWLEDSGPTAQANGEFSMRPMTAEERERWNPATGTWE